MRTRTVALGLAALLALAVATACGGDQGGGPGGDSTVPPSTEGSQHVLGSPQAPVELIEYADFQ
ncbi:MAG: hypothetical protein Q7R32_04935 [Dehalococcoidia bacterium]|nr:hypothetical protein [Dehalococcoidia bacterium]